MSTFKYLLVTAAVTALALTGCIKNDIPYPRIQPIVREFKVEGASQASNIDSLTRTITVFLDEKADIYNVDVTDISLSCGELCDSSVLKSPIDLSSVYYLDVKLYQEYTWVVKGVQEIERYFTVANQIGTSVIDVPGHRIVAYVPEGLDLKKVNVELIKLGSPDAVMNPDIEGQCVDFSKPVKVNVTDYGRTETWTIYIEHTEMAVSTERIDAWTNVAWLYGKGEAGKDNGFEYRMVGSETWIKVPEEWVTHSGGDFTARLIHLEAETEYEARPYSGDEYGAPMTFTTETIAELPNGSMDDWWLDGKIWCPWAEGGTPYWGTGNKGATTLGTSNSVPTDDTSSGTGHAAMLETRFVGIGIVGKLAAGNIFTGTYVRTEGTNGVLDFGREFTLHPTRLRGWMKYHSAEISSVTAGFEDLKGLPDTCQIYCALVDLPKPLEIRTNPKDRQLFDPNASYVVAYGSLKVGEDVPKYTPFDIELKYRDTSRKPKYIIVVASASWLGDFFTGGNGSVLYVDDFLLEYDY